MTDIKISLRDRHEAERILWALDVAGHALGLWDGAYGNTYRHIAAQLNNTDAQMPMMKSDYVVQSPAPFGTRRRKEPTSSP